MGVLDDISKRVRNFDAFAKTLDDFKVRTKTGGVVSIIAYVVMIMLFVSELRFFMTYETETRLVVDNSREEALSIYIDVHFPKISCNLLGIDAIDVTGNAQLELVNEVFKIRTDEQGNPIPASKDKKAHRIRNLIPQTGEEQKDGGKVACGSCYGAKHGCCNTCDEVKEAYEQRNWVLIDLDDIEQCVREGVAGDNQLVEGEGCLVKGKVDVAKVAGNFHIAPGHSFDFHGRHLHNVGAFKNQNLNLSHRINQLSYGASFPGQKNPLDGREKKLASSDKLGMHQYFIKVVPTTYKKLNGQVITSNQYSVTEYFRPGEAGKTSHILPGIFFIYDMSPIKVELTEKKERFLHFIVQLCAIIGGVFTVMGMIDASVYHGGKVIRKKLQIGKAD
mmetsp:Transcript_572/g.1938  ORF Transcript_572/g.1938 Transcript_572/m.1938 type:complete len:390 (+) Transcript_572:248-1417(+)|eukprot:CAMPEP_0198728032 /NCGR_PEP_ID=MMETSP1475-20131203/6688_1 /TAXON_ID= ORGANISM="Unidentified sp., Strain CCMP1999" /NCGR_SAMPLE_ID=MMETSP1475 /ASSEMBLY_ACC=CAM_ASM_001111 /LENGTH=389 /DNA_ID=CAMNT_0044490277 /DNA_START=216 /DNA_END=1385 /DNA_ORIENTATION=-